MLKNYNYFLVFTLFLKLVATSPTTIQPESQNDAVEAETTTFGYYIEDTEIVEEKPSAIVVQDSRFDDEASPSATLPDSVPATTNAPSSLVQEPEPIQVEPDVASDDQKQQQQPEIVKLIVRQDESEPDDENEDEGDDEEEEEQQNQPGGPPGPRPPRPPRPHLLIPAKPGGLYKESANSTQPIRIPSITLLQQQADATSTTTTTSTSTTTAPTEITSTKYSRIRTTQATKPTTVSAIRRRPITIPTTTAKVLTFAEEWNLTNFFHTHTGPQGRADCECGKVPFKLENADAAGVNVYPWAVAVVRSGIFGGGRPHCGGTLINDRFVVTAVHCVIDLYAEDMQVWLTAHNSFAPVDNFVQSDRVVKRNVAEIMMHPNYNRRSHDNDIALLKLGSTIDISSSSYFTPICLAAADNAYAGLTARVVGWGSDSNSNRFSNHKLCKEDVPVLANDVCIRDTVHGDKITGNMMCAGLLTPDKNQECLGDAGSGLTIPNGGRYTLIGVVSWGYQSRVSYSPVVYTKVSGYSDWLLHNTREADWCIV